MSTQKEVPTLIVIRRERVIKQEGNYLLMKVDLRKTPDGQKAT